MQSDLELSQQGLLKSAVQFYRVVAVHGDGSVTTERMRDRKCVVVPAANVRVRNVLPGMIVELNSGGKAFFADTRNENPFARREQRRAA